MLTLIIVIIAIGFYMLKKILTYKEYKKYKEGYELIRRYIFEKYERLRFDKFIRTPISAIEVAYNVIYNGMPEKKAIHSCIVDRKRYKKLMISRLENEEKRLKKQYKDGQISLEDIQSLLDKLLSSGIA